MKIFEGIGLIFRIIISLFAFILMVPFSYIVPKKKNLIIFIGNLKSNFYGNVKYFYLYVNRYHHKDCEFYFLAEDRNTFDELKMYGLPVIFFPSFKSIFTLYRTKIVIIDNNRWVTKLRFYFLFTSHKVQLWHGVGFKRIDHDLIDHRTKRDFLRYCINTLKGRFPKYDLFISTSEFYSKNVFSKAFNYSNMVELGYSRNGIFFQEPDKLSLINTDVENYNKIADLKDQGYKIILYAPTFRDLGGDALTENILDIKRLTDFAYKNKLHFVFKFHPAPQYRFNLEQLKEVTLYDNSKDVYPLLPKVDLMITDYSSIYTDYLLLDRPVIFFPYDYEYYVQQNREIQFDYDWITPGPKCYTQDDLEKEILQILIKNEDGYIQKREEILDLAFKYKDGNSSERIWQYIKKYFN